MCSVVIAARGSHSQTAVSNFNDPDRVLSPRLSLLCSPSSTDSHFFFVWLSTLPRRSITHLSASAIPNLNQGQAKMLLGKRPRPPMKRTTSLSEISSDPSRQIAGEYSNEPDQMAVAGGGAMLPGIHRRHSADFSHTPDFLRSCSLCKRPLVPSHDIYMYRGDSAFCSVECRQQAMNRDERKEKCSLVSKKKFAAHHSAGSKVAANGETVGAI